MQRSLTGAIMLAIILSSLVACGSAFAPRTRTPYVLAPTTVVPPQPTSTPGSAPIIISTQPPGVTTSSPVPRTPSPTVRPSASITADKRVVGNTGGTGGANLRQTPDGPVIGTFPDGTVMTLLGAQEQAGGRLWMKVEAPNGATGWMLSIVLLVERR